MAQTGREVNTPAGPRRRTPGPWSLLRAARAGLALLLVASCAPGGDRARRDDESTPVLVARTLVANIETPGATRVGSLIWRGGVALTADDPRFGGWSDLWISEDGRALRAVSDEGAWLAATVDYDPAGRLAGVSRARLGRLKDVDGRPLRAKADADAEGLAVLADGATLVSFERRHRVLRFPPGPAPSGGLAGVPRAVATPPELEGAPRNGGVEAIAALPDGGLALITEEMAGRRGAMTGWLGAPAAGGWRWARFHYPVGGGFRPTGAAALPGGGIVVVERSVDPLRGWRVRLTRVDSAALAAAAASDGVVPVEELARLETPWATENIEGVAARRGPRGETLLWLISDDNFSPLQRTVLLHFELAPR